MNKVEIRKLQELVAELEAEKKALVDTLNQRIVNAIPQLESDYFIGFNDGIISWCKELIARIEDASLISDEAYDEYSDIIFTPYDKKTGAFLSYNQCEVEDDV